MGEYDLRSVSHVASNMHALSRNHPVRGTLDAQLRVYEQTTDHIEVVMASGQLFTESFDADWLTRNRSNSGCR